MTEAAPASRTIRGANVDPAIERRIRVTLDGMFKAFVDGDLHAWKSFVVPTEELAWIATGPEEYAVGFETLSELMEVSLSGTSDRRFDYEIRTIASENGVAWISGDAMIGAHAGGRDIELPFRYTGVFVERDGPWLIAQFHQSVGDARQLGPTWDTLMDTVATEAQREGLDLRAQAAPDGTVTLMFSDIEDSTGLNEQLGDLQWIEVLRTHNEIVRERAGAHGGTEVKTIGDAFMIAFPSARRAVLCAIDLQRAFEAYAGEHPEAPLRVRIGLHAGEPIREGGDFYGKSVTLASRIAGHAHGGEILVSSLLKELVEAAGDVAFEGDRSAELKGFPNRNAYVRSGGATDAARAGSRIT